ncbi:hypothetical protein NE237_024899 [Protea cynaroides]|uniref:AP complex mu/sigma subunit domain-containing protein n=1 Tax=Protea cynaroides TaxID=273540 RepID=A0A9Q0H3V7_9MAGN|nr:hypothetical protein NE237_024899 [Protea cynaroides]
MGIRFILLVNKQGQTRLAQYYEYLTLEQRRALEGEIVRKCLARTEQQCSFVEHRNYKIVYRRYASLFFLVGVDNDENELAILEFIHLLVETMDRHFGNVCELDIMFHLEKAHFMLEETILVPGGTDTADGYWVLVVWWVWCDGSVGFVRGLQKPGGKAPSRSDQLDYAGSKLADRSRDVKERTKEHGQYVQHEAEEENNISVDFASLCSSNVVWYGMGFSGLALLLR